MTSCTRSAWRSTASAHRKIAGSASASAIPDIDLAMMARAQGAVGIGPVTTVEAMHEAMKQGVQAVQDGGVCAIDARVAPGYDAD
jgi:hypothetical protein